MKSPIINLFKTAVLAIFTLLMTSSVSAQSKFRVGVAGLNHDHIYNILNDYSKGRVYLVGIAEPNKHLWEKYGKQFHIPDSLFFTDLKEMATKRKPDIMLGYNAVGNHVDVVEVCGPLHIPVMVEKPLAATLTQAKRIQDLANKYHIDVLTNYETTWYPSFQKVYDIIGQDSIGAIHKMVAHDGHQGPREIGCSEEFLAWLTDPVLNGAGALNDFGCYGANLMTWLMHGERPVAVSAVAKHFKPNVYPKVEDDATITVEYANATGLIEGSWAWPFSIKDLEVFGDHGYLHATDGKNLTMRLRENIKSTPVAEPLAQPNDDPVTYFNAFLQHKISATDDRSSLKYNMIVMEILDAAKRSIKEGKRIVL